MTHGLPTRIDNELDDLLPPYRIDLSLLASLTHPALIDHVRRVGVVLYGSPPAAVAVRPT